MLSRKKRQDWDLATGGMWAVKGNEEVKGAREVVNNKTGDELAGSGTFEWQKKGVKVGRFELLEVKHHPSGKVSQDGKGEFWSREAELAVSNTEVTLESQGI